MSLAIRRHRPVLALALFALLAAALFFRGGAASASPPTANSRGGTSAASPLGVEAAAAKTYTTTLDFSNPFDTHTFTVKVAPGGNRLTADTMDCCIAGDHWGVFLMRYGGTPTGVSNPNASNCGTGSTSAFSGAATLSGTYLSNKVAQIIITHCSGVSSFPAGLTVRFTSNVNIAVTQQT